MSIGARASALSCTGYSAQRSRPHACLAILIRLRTARSPKPIVPSHYRTRAEAPGCSAPTRRCTARRRQTAAV
eukprot:1587926-Prymnesium_polylepis.1